MNRKYKYEAFGKTVSTSNATGNPFRYAGEYYDEESGMIYLRARYYDPTLGRFINEDPIKDGWNWHTYCGNNTVNRVDPWGLFDTLTRLSINSNNVEDTILLQKTLNSWGYVGKDGKPLIENGVFDKNTEYAVNMYKNDYDLWNFGTYEGAVGLTTWEHMGLPYEIPSTYLLPAPQKDVITADVNFGYGLYGDVEIAGARVELGGKAYYSLSDIAINPSMTYEAAAQIGLTNKLSAGASGCLKVNQLTGEHIHKGGYAGLIINGEVFGIDALKSDKDIVVTLSAGTYLVAGGEVTIEFNVSEFIRKYF